MPSLDFDSEVREFKSFYADNYWRLKAAEESYRTLVSLLLADHEGFAVPLVTSRVKERDECIAKFGRKYRAKLEDSQTPYSIREHITDLVGIRVVCLYYTDIEPIKAILIENFELLDITDRISLIESSDDSFGYKGLHLDFKLKSPRSDQPEYSRFRDFQPNKVPAFASKIPLLSEAHRQLAHKNLFPGCQVRASSAPRTLVPACFAQSPGEPKTHFSLLRPGA